MRENKLVDYSPFASSLVNNVLLQSAPHFNQSLFMFVQVIAASFVHTLLHGVPGFKSGLFGGHRSVA